MNDIIKSNIWDLYDPQWEQKWQIHKDAYEKAAALNEDTTPSLNGMKETWVSQFKNAPEYAHYIINQFKNSPLNKEIIWVDISDDIAKTQTKQDVNDLYNKTIDFIERQKREQRNSIALDKTSGLFDETASSSFHINLPPPAYSLHPVETILTIEEKNGQANICFTHLKSNRGTSVINAIEFLANGLYKEQMGKKYPDPSKINWYTHIPAGETSLSESFMKVEMIFSGNSFKNANFDCLSSVPKAIKQAQFNAAESEITLSPVKYQQKKDEAENKIFSGFGNVIKRFLG